MTLLALSQACVQNLGVSFYFQTFFYISLMSSFSNFLTSSRLVGFFRLTAPAAMLGHLGAISLKHPNFLTTSQDVTKGADQAIYIKRDGFSLQICKWMKNSQNVCSIEFCRAISIQILK